jgi:hypothetical protein
MVTLDRNCITANLNEQRRISQLRRMRKTLAGKG